LPGQEKLVPTKTNRIDPCPLDILSNVVANQQSRAAPSKRYNKLQNRKKLGSYLVLAENAKAKICQLDRTATMRHERLYASFNWIAMALALVGTVLGAIALGTAWYRVEDSSRFTTTYYRWEGGTIPLSYETAQMSAFPSKINKSRLNYILVQWNPLLLVCERTWNTSTSVWRASTA
jgi:hypothetical protein